jgi:hypothetical protein
MPRDKDNPIREYEEDAEEAERKIRRFSLEIGKYGASWRVMGALADLSEMTSEEANKLNKMWETAFPGVKHVTYDLRNKDKDKEDGVVAVARAVKHGEQGFPMIRWAGCLWHLAIECKVQEAGSRGYDFFKAACGDVFGMRPGLEGRMETDPSQSTTCSSCWESVVAAKVAHILGRKEEDGG